MLFKALDNLTEWCKHSDSFTRREQAIENMFIKQKEKERFATHPLFYIPEYFKALLMYGQSDANKKEARPTRKTP